MARNKIGIEVQVEFPTISALQEQVSKKFDDKIQLMVKLGVSKESISDLKKSIQNVLDTNSFKFDLDLGNTLKDLDNVKDRVEEIDKLIGKKRTFNIDFNIKDMDKTMEEVLKNASEASEELTKKAKEHAEERKKAYQDEVEAVKRGALDVKNAQETIYNQGEPNETRRFRLVDDLGDGKTQTTTVKWGGNRDVTNADDVAKRAKEALKEQQDLIKEIEDQLKARHKIEMDLVNAEGKYKDELEKQWRTENNLLETLKTQYYTKYSINGLSADTTKELIRQQRAQLDIRNAIKEQRDEVQAENELNREIQGAISKVVQLENKKQQLARQIVTATEEEAEWLRKQYDHYDDIQKKLMTNYDVMNEMTDAQREEYENIRRIGFLQREQLQARQEQREEAQRQAEIDREQARNQQQALREMLSDLNEIHKIEMQIQDIRERHLASGVAMTREEQQQLDLLQAQLDLAQRNARQTEITHTYQGNMTDEIGEQVDIQRQVLEQERQRASELSRVQGQADRVNDAMRQWADLNDEINRLQRDLIFAGMREESIIQNQVDALRNAQDAVMQRLHSEGLVTDEIRQQITETQRLQQRTNEINQARQDAREKDQAYDDVGGIIDPMDTWDTFEMSFETILDSMAEVDEAYMKVAKVAEASEESLKSFKEASYDTASSLGVSAGDYMSAVETWVTAGKTFVESQELAKTSLIGSFVGNIDPDLMVKWMAVPLEAFKKDGLEANDVINVMNETANKHAVEMEELGKAYMRSATTVQSAGVSFEDLTGLITGAQEATRMGGERIGTALKTVALNYNLIQSQITKDQKKKFNFFDSIGINLSETDSLTDALGKLHEKWADLTEEQQSTALYYIAGKEHSNVVSGIVSQWDTVKSAIQDANEEMGKGADGSAYKEFAKQKESVRFQIAELKNAWQEMLNTIGESDGTVSKILDGLVKGLQKVTDILQNDKAMDALKFVAMAVAMHAVTNGAFRMADAFKTGFGKMMGTITDLFPALDNLINKIKGVGTASTALETVQDMTDGGDSGDGSNRNNDHDTTHDTRRRNSAGQLIDSAGNVIEDIEEAGDATDRSTSRMASGLGKVMDKAGKVLSLIPFIGDALVLLDIAGVPVFDGLAKGFGVVFETQDKVLAKQKEVNDEFAKGNDLMNGRLDDAQSNTDDMRKKFQSFDTDKKKEGVQGDMSPEEFRAFKEQFNAQVDDLKLGADVKITMNDTSHIQAQLDLMDKRLKELRSAEAVNIADKLGGDVAKLEATRSQIEGLKFEQGELAKRAEEARKQMKALTEKDGTVKPENLQAYNMWANELASVNGRAKNVSDTLKHQETAYKQTQTAVQNEANALLKLGGQFDATKIKGEDQIGVYKAMVSQLNGLKGTLNNTSSAQNVLKNNSKLTNDQFQEILRLVPEAKKKYGDYSVNAVNSDAKVRKGLEQTIQKEHEKAQSAVDAGNKSVTAMEKVVGSTGKGKEAMDKAKKSADNLKTSFDKVPASKKAHVDVEVTGIKWLDKIINFFSRSWSTTATVKAGGNASTKAPAGSNRNGFVSVGGVRSNSVSASASTVPVQGVGSTVVNNATSTTKDNTPPAKVNSDVWRYWDNEMYGLYPIQETLDIIARLMKANADDNKKMIYYYQQQQQMQKNLIVENTRLRSEKQSEMKEVLSKLRGYGFTSDSYGRITNLSHAKALSGDKASEAEELLNTWKSLYTEIDDLFDQVEDSKQAIKDLDEQIKQTKIKDELESWDAYLKSVDASLTSINNKDNIFSKKLGFISGDDTELALTTNEQAMNDAKGNLSSLITQFNKLSTANIAYEENGTALKSTLEKISQEMLTQADAIIKYQQAINDLEISRVTQDLNEFNTAVDTNQDRINNNISNLKEGLLSGTDFGDLVSSNSVGLDLSRDNQFEQSAKDRIALEQEVDDALAGFAKKNIDRQKGVANATLQIEVNKFNQMLKMQSDYTAGKKATATEIKDTFDDLFNVGMADEDYTFVDKLDDAFDELKDKQDALTKKYENDMAKALTPEDKDKLTNQFIMDNLELQQDYYEASIKANNDAIAEFKNQLKDSTLTDEQEDKINAQIASLEKENIDSQNKIKDAVKQRFELEFSLLEESVSEYDKYSSQLEYSQKLIKALGGEHYDAQGAIMGSMLSVEKARNATIASTLASLQDELKLYEEGSYEWSLINAQVENYNKMLQDSNLTLLDMNKNIMTNSFDSTMDKLEKSLFDGKTIDAYKDYHDLWMTGLEKEFELEQMHQRIADLGTKAYDEKMALLDKQEKLSRFEMDYLNKQLDVLELQQKLENLNKEKTIQTLKQNADGTWDWTYEADADQISKTQEELQQAQIELQQQEQQAREEYADKLQKILDDAENGQYETIEDFQNAIDDLTEAYGDIIGDIPEIKDEYLNNLIEAYAQYIKDNGDVLAGTTPTTTTTPEETYEGLSNEIVKAFNQIGEDFGSSFADALIAKLPSLGINPTPTSETGKSVSIHLGSLEFPNVKSAEGLKEAILNLPQIALQKAKEKL